MPQTGSPLRKIAAAGIVVGGACLVVAILVFGMSAKSATGRDYLQYWALEQQLAHHANPYDTAALFHVERAAGMTYPGVLISLSPPVVFAYALPLGWVSARVGLIFWMLLQLGCLGASVWVLWLLHGRPESRWHVIALGFPPALWSLVAGQLGIFFLLDVVLFLYFVRRRPWLAGASLVFCALKPQLFVPLVVVLLLWSVVRRDFRVVAGFVLALAVSCGLTLWIDPHVWGEYARMMQTRGAADLYVPTVGMALRLSIDRGARWIGYIPEACGCVWAAWYFLTRRERWDWNREGLLVMLVSLACTPYSFYSDQALLFPAVLVGLYETERYKAKKSVVFLALFVAIAGAGMVGFVVQIPMTSAFYIWTAPAWLIWYLYAMRSAVRAETVQGTTVAAG